MPRALRVRNLGPASTKNGRQARHNIVRIYGNSAADIQSYFQQYPQLNDYFAYITAHGYIISDSGGYQGTYGDLAISPSRNGGTFAAMPPYVKQTINEGLTNFEKSEIEYIDIHIKVRNSAR